MTLSKRQRHVQDLAVLPEISINEIFIASCDRVVIEFINNPQICPMQRKISGTLIFAFAAPAVNDSELDKRCVLCYTENATNPMIIAGDHYAPENSN